MDKGKQDWSWLPAQMPVVAKLMREKRVELGDRHVNLCWKNGVVLKEPGWFFAREGALAVGTPWKGDPELENFAALSVALNSPLLILRPTEVSSGT